MPYTKRDLVGLLVEALNEAADWRDLKAEEYPDDQRNRHAAVRLRLVAEHARNLPDDSPALVDLDECAEIANRLDLYLDHSLGREGMDRIGFHNVPPPGASLDSDVSYAASLALDSLRTCDVESAA